MIGGYSESLLYYIFISCKLVIRHYNFIKVLQKTKDLNQNRCMYIFIYSNIARRMFSLKKNPLPFHEFLNFRFNYIYKAPLNSLIVWYKLLDRGVPL